MMARCRRFAGVRFSEAQKRNPAAPCGNAVPGEAARERHLFLRQRRRAAARFYCAAWGREKTKLVLFLRPAETAPNFLLRFPICAGLSKRGAPFGRSGWVVPEGNPFGRDTYSRALCVRRVPCAAVSLPSLSASLPAKCPVGISTLRVFVAQ